MEVVYMKLRKVRKYKTPGYPKKTEISNNPELLRNLPSRWKGIYMHVCAHERIVMPIADRLAEKLFKKKNAMFIQKHYNDVYPLISLIEDKSSDKVDKHI